MVNKLLLAKDKFNKTAWHLAVENPETLEKLWERGKETLTAGELNNKLLLAKDSAGQTAWHYASRGGNIQLL
jgi:ankyrin repeat protein